MSTLVYPIFLHRMQGAQVVVVGGGKIGERKVEGLLAVGAQVRLISPQATNTLQRMAGEGQFEWIAHLYQPGDLAGALLAFAATDRREVNVQVASDAVDQHIGGDGAVLDALPELVSDVTGVTPAGD